MSTSTNSPEPSLQERQEFFKECQYHDWYYEYSDDGRVYDRGRSAYAKLSGKANSHPKFLEIYKAWEKYVWGGPTFARESKPKPVMPEV